MVLRSGYLTLIAETNKWIILTNWYRGDLSSVDIMIEGPSIDSPLANKPEDDKHVQPNDIVTENNIAKDIPPAPNIVGEYNDMNNAADKNDYNINYDIYKL